MNDEVPAARGMTSRTPFEEMLKAEPAPTPPPPVKLAASRPDAAPRKLDTALRVAVHAIILMSVLAFVVYYCVWSPVRGQLLTQRESAIATVVAYPLYAVRTPDVSGVFIAEKALANGAYVKKGQLLGRINSPALDAQIEQKALELQILQARQLQPRQSSDAQGAWQSDQEARELTLRVASASKSLEQFNTLKKQLIVRAPCDGFIQFGLAGSQAVQPHQALV
jgi:multidrug resistance efflux pump